MITIPLSNQLQDQHILHTYIPLLNYIYPIIIIIIIIMYCKNKMLTSNSVKSANSPSHKGDQYVEMNPPILIDYNYNQSISLI